MGLIAAFLNPLAFTRANALGINTLTAAEGAGAVVRGMTRQAGNEIDEFVTGGAAQQPRWPATGSPDHEHGARPRYRRADAERGTSRFL